MARICLDCTAPISTQSRTGRCRQCAARRTATTRTFEERSRASRAALADPVKRAARIRQLVVAGRTARQDPAFMERLREHGRQLRRHVTPEAEAKRLERSRRSAAKRTATMLYWCPPEYLEEYRRLLRRGDFNAAKARAAIEAKMTPFDRQMQRVRNGAGITTKFTGWPTATCAGPLVSLPRAGA